MGIADVFAGLFKPAADVINKYQERKQAKETGKQKVKIAQLDNENSLDLSEAEWEAIAVKGNETTWKDEYLTVVITGPFLLILIGSIFAPFDFGATLVSAGTSSIASLNGLTGDYAMLLKMVVAAGIGINLKRKLFQ